MILANNETDLLVYTFKDKMCTVKCTCICHSVYLEIYTASTHAHCRTKYNINL